MSSVATVIYFLSPNPQRKRKIAAEEGQKRRFLAVAAQQRVVDGSKTVAEGES